MLHIRTVKLHLIILLAVLVAASFFVFFRLTQADTLTDEVEVAFRSIGYLDFLATPAQTTPYQWFTAVPGWVKLSFHDHPPLLFGLQHGLFQLFGDSLLVLRIPFALFGLLSIFLLYLIARDLMGVRVGVLAAGLATFSSYFIWISRIGLQEIAVICLSLLAFWLVIRSIQKPRLLLGWGIVFGLAMLTKYTAIIILPVCLIFILLWNKKLFKNINLYLGLLLALILFSPVVVYNIQLNNAVGHFDLQLSSLLSQQTPEWSILPGKQIGSFSARLTSLYPNLLLFTSPAFFWSWVISLLGLLYLVVYKRIYKVASSIEIFLLITLVLYHLFIVVIGPSIRFLTLLLPWQFLTMAYLLNKLLTQPPQIYRNLGYGLLGLLAMYQSIFIFQTNHVKAVGESRLFYSPHVRIESSAWGYNQLEEYLVQLLDTKKSAVKLDLPDSQQFIIDVRQKDYRHNDGNPEAKILIIYDPRINNVAKLWLYDRRFYYDGWPFVSVDEYVDDNFASTNQLDQLDIKAYYYIATTEYTQTGGNTTVSQHANEFNSSLSNPIESIKKNSGEVVFEIYKSDQPF